MKFKCLKLLACTLLSVCLFTCFGATNCFAAVVTDGSSFYELGDVNKDKIVNIIDLVRLKKYLASQSELLKSAADINSDGKIDASDLLLLKKNMLGIEYSTDFDWNAEIK